LEEKKGFGGFELGAARREGGTALHDQASESFELVRQICRFRPAPLYRVPSAHAA
jgi:hypothetical protein